MKKRDRVVIHFLGKPEDGDCDATINEKRLCNLHLMSYSFSRLLPPTPMLDWIIPEESEVSGEVIFMMRSGNTITIKGDFYMETECPSTS